MRRPRPLPPASTVENGKRGRHDTSSRAFTHNLPHAKREESETLIRTGRYHHTEVYLAASGHLIPEQIATRRKRILAVVTNPYCDARNAFMDAAISGGVMDSMGGWKRTHPGRIISKYPACTLYQFVLAYENCQQPGYTTEKIMDAINADAIPIHWGAHQTDFNPGRIISRGDFESDTALLDHVRELTRHPDKLAEIINRPAILQEQDIRPHVRGRVREVILGMKG